MRRVDFRSGKKRSFPAWYQRILADGTTYYTPQRYSKRKIILAAPGDRDPSPGELATALNAHPEAELERGATLLVEHDVEDTTEKPASLPGGVYSYERADHVIPDRLEPMEVRDDSYLRLPGVYESLASDIDHFTKGESIYRKLGFQYRRGILLYGPPGNGKTSLIREILRAQIPNDSLVFFMDRIPSRHFIRVIRETLFDRLKVIIFEEMAATLKNSDLDHALAFLDGEISLDRCLILATTNYPERLPGNIVDRPSRFDRLYRISDPNEECRSILLRAYLGRPAERSEIDSTKGLSTAGLRECRLLVRLKNLSLHEASLQLKRHKEIVKREFGVIGEIGLSAKSHFFDAED